ncbi:uncharacterized protein A1O9_02382 [Exophiala aquamarina CBS 119918]|uniref:Ubiquitin carboxyl-terminal hydrolase n=1 Tax=Exophiala aquamarina CBS 119918 TaxID=1182545 RepID=A0A072PYZ0_9EURO|nr:uncharacterized protein A1O9_02382 [Exophiala aquamarina CBS 119918]KEF60820.1 hypothetical protein A1O9_02382 [Exophiala aquamarina CBS 119918]
MAYKTYIPLENNPDVMTKLAHQLGLSPVLSFHDVFSLTEPSLIAMLPRPASALLFIYPETDLSRAYSAQERASDKAYNGSGPDEPVIWYPQLITHACGLMGLLHCTTNSPAAELIQADSELDKFRKAILPLKPTERGQYVHDSDILEKAHAVAAQAGDTIAPALGEDPGHAFIAFVKGKDGHLYELNGCRKGPVDRGILEEDEDVLSDNALALGPLPYLKREEKAGNGVLNFSCTVLAPSIDG